MNQPLTQQRIRIRFGQDGPLRYVGHHDLARAWERVLRRAEAPLEYSQGFNPRPRMQLAAALPVGVSSESELLDVWLTRPLDPLGEWIERLQATSPHGLTALAIEDIPIREPALPALVTHAEYTLTPLDPALDRETLASRVDELLRAERLERERSNGKRYDLRPLIRELALLDDGVIWAAMAAGDAGVGRADELVDALGLSLIQLRAHRIRLHLRRAGTDEAP